MWKMSILCFLAIVASTYDACAQTLQYSVRLQDYGFTQYVHPKSEGEGDVALTSHLGIDAAGLVYVGFSIEGEPTLLKNGEVKNKFRVLTINPEKQTVERTLDFPTASVHRVGLNLSANDSLVVTADEKVQLLDEAGSPKSIFSIPQVPTKHHYRILDIKQSPSGRILLISTDTDRTDSDYNYFLRTDNLSTVTECNITYGRNKDRADTFSDSLKFRDYNPPDWELVGGNLCEASRNLVHYDSFFVPYVVDNSTLLIIEPEVTTTKSSTITILKMNRGEVWHETLPKHFIFPYSSVAISRDGSRFAMSVLEVRGGSRFFDVSWKVVSESIVVYDAQTGKHIGSLKMPNYPVKFELSLSPHGDKLVMLKGGVVEIWVL